MRYTPVVAHISSQPVLGEISQPAMSAAGADIRMNTMSAYGGKKVTRQSRGPAKRISVSVKNW